MSRSELASPSLEPTPPVEEQLSAMLSEAREGSTDALAWLFHRFAGRVHRVAYRITRSRLDAEDVLQDVFVRLPEALHGYGGRSPFDRWLASVTARMALSCLRKASSRHEDRLFDHAIVQPESEDQIDRIAIADAIASLDPDARAILVLRAEGYSHVEIGEMLSIKPGTSEVRVFRARTALRALLRGDK